MSPLTVPSVIAPTGEQLEIVAGDQRAVIVEVGGGLRSYAVAGTDLLDGYRPDEMAPSGRGQVLIPWPNRLREGRYEFDGTRHEVPINEPELGNAIHGLVRWVNWSVAEREEGRVVVRHTLHPQPGYPFTLALQIEYTLSADGLSVRTSATNVGQRPCPFGHGAHPWLTFGTPTVDDATLRIPARVVIDADGRGLPTGARQVGGTDFDFRVARPIGATKIDNAFREIERDADGIARVSFADPGGRAITLWVDQAYPYVQLSTGDVLPDVNRRSLAVEPMTCPPNAFQSSEALIRLEPGDTFTGNWGISPH